MPRSGSGRIERRGAHHAPPYRFPRPPKGGYRGVKKAAGVVALPGAERSCRCPKGGGSVRSVGVRHMPSPTASNEDTHKGWHGCRAAIVPGTRRLGDGGWVSNTARRATALPR